MTGFYYAAPVLIVYNPPLSRAYFVFNGTKIACSIYETRYFLGMTPPNYPVPAIRYV